MHPRSVTARLLLIAACLGLSLPVRAGAADITSCGETVAAGETGVLQADLNCSGSGSFAVRLLQKAMLDLNGHTLTGGPTDHTVLGVAAADGSGRANLTIVGPGVIAGTAPNLSPFKSGNSCIFLSQGRARITSPTGIVDIHGCETGIVGGAPTSDGGPTGKVTMDHVDLHDNVIDGSGLARVTATNVNVYNHFNGVGMSAKKMRLTGIAAHHNDVGLGGQDVKGANVTASNNSGATTAASGNGVFAGKRVNLTNLVAMNNAGPGLFGHRVKLVDSTLTNNGLLPPHLTIDIQSDTRPRLVNTICLHSEMVPSGDPWGVCVDDAGSPSGAFLGATSARSMSLLSRAGAWVSFLLQSAGVGVFVQ